MSEEVVVFENSSAVAEANEVNKPGVILEMMEPVAKKFPGSVMSFHNISYTVRLRKPICGKFRGVEKKTILNDVSGILRPGLNALMGTTGSGKSTLLDVLARRKDPHWLSGIVLLDGRSVPKNFQYISGYVMQNDLFVATVSVRETLWFCANLRLPTSVTHDEKRKKIEQIIEDLGLQRCADTKVGNDMIRGISGGEKKRTSIAAELILEPKILFLDEPTTGLDSATAWSVISLLKRLGNQGHTIVCSIHQPRYSIYKMFDSLTLLSKGDLVYHGAAKHALPFFENLGYICETHDNPADFYLDVLNRGHGGNDASEENILALTETIKDSYRNSDSFTELQRELEKIESNASDTKVKTGQMYATGVFQQMKVLLNRTGKNMLRNPQSFIGNAVVNIIIGLVFGILYFDVDMSADTGVQNRLGVMFFMCTNLLFGASLVIDNFVKERDIFIREHVSGYYSVFTYFMSKVLADLIPLRTLSPLIFCTISYWMVGFKADAGDFFTFLLIALLTGYSGVGIGLFYSATFRQAVSQLVLILTFVFSIIFSGLLVNLDYIMPWISWLKYLSIPRYGLTAMSINELSGLVFWSCTNSTSFEKPTGKFFGSATPNMSVQIMPDGRRCTTARGEEFLQSVLSIELENGEVSSWDLWQNIVALGCIFIGLHVLTYIQLARKKKYS